MSERIHIDESKRSAEPRDKEHPQYESRIADPVDDESLVFRVTRRLAMKLETNQKIRTQPHALHLKAQQHLVVGENQREHGEHEEVQVSEEPVVSALMRHVPGRINMDQHPNARNKQDRKSTR